MSLSRYLYALSNRLNKSTCFSKLVVATRCLLRIVLFKDQFRGSLIKIFCNLLHYFLAFITLNTFHSTRTITSRRQPHVVSWDLVFWTADLSSNTTACRKHVPKAVVLLKLASWFRPPIIIPRLKSMKSHFFTHPATNKTLSLLSWAPCFPFLYPSRSVVGIAYSHNSFGENF